MLQGFHILTTKLRKALAQLPNLPRALGLVWGVARNWTIAWMALLVVQGLLPVGLVYLTKLVVDGILEAVRNSGAWSTVRGVLIKVAFLGAIMLLTEIARSAANLIRTVQAERLEEHIRGLIHEKSASVDLAFYEFPDYFDHLHRARSEATYRPVALLENLGSLLQNGITLVAMGAVLIPLGPWLALALLLSTLPALFVVIYYTLAEYQWHQRTTADERLVWYFDWVLTAAEAAAELRLFGLGKFFQDAHRKLRGHLRRERISLLVRQSKAEFAASLTALLITGAAMTLMIWQALHGRISLGELALIYAAFNQGQGLMRTLLGTVAQVYANSLFIGNLFEFLALEPIVVDQPTARGLKTNSLQNEIAFQRVTFSYPGSEVNALADFDLSVRKGEIVALVGSNGAGKSTLVKLLCRFYDPQQGAITLDGVNLKEIPAAQLRSLITVLFQQPVHYNTTVNENVSYGALNQSPQQDDIIAAVKAAGAEEIVSRLNNGYESLLGKWFVGGTELSVGEWQRIALARAFLRKAPIIILDEPTSALDPWAEVDWLLRFRQLAIGRTAIIITHRFTTAMHADVIHVMEYGRVVESGSHGELLERNGRYAKSWKRQMNAESHTLLREV
ncbi:MAG: ABC transporter ATP-binding protein [Pyrinomonadaceae bacterium]